MSEVIAVRVADEVKKRVQEKAADAGLKPSQYVANLIHQDVGWTPPDPEPEPLPDNPRKPARTPRKAVGRKKSGEIVPLSPEDEAEALKPTEAPFRRRSNVTPLPKGGK